MSDQKLTVDQETCIQCGNCVAAYPDLFEFTDDGKVHVKKDADFSKHDLAEVKNICPSSAIKELEAKAEEKSEEK
jgi:ferredoxin